MQLIELHEQQWFPSIFRNGITEILRTLCKQMRVHEVIHPVLEDLLHRSGATRVVDLCSGAGGPIVTLYESGLIHVPAVLTDRFPNPDAYRLAERNTKSLVTGHGEPVDATKVPPELTGLRTIFNAFHHFPPPLARAILVDAYASRQPIAIFEITERSAFNTLSNFILSFLTMLVMLPKMRPFRWQWWLFTYLLPVLPVAFGWDGTVSCLRSYTDAEFKELTRAIADDSYTWSTGRLAVPGSPMKVNYFCGIPHK